MVEWDYVARGSDGKVVFLAALTPCTLNVLHLLKALGVPENLVILGDLCNIAPLGISFREAKYLLQTRFIE